MNFPKKMKQKVIRIPDNFQMKPLHGNIKIVQPRSKSSIRILSEYCPYHHHFFTVGSRNPTIY